MVYVQLTKTFRVSGCEDLDLHTDAVMDELLALENEVVVDSDVTAELAAGIVTVSITAGGDDFDSAAKLADSCIRAAIHAAGGHTPGWRTLETASRELQAA